MPLYRYRPWRRRILAAGLAAGSVAAALHTLAPGQPPGHRVVVVQRPVPAGGVVGPADVVATTRPGDQPRTAISDVAVVVGRVATSPLDVDEVVTAGRLVGAGPAASPGEVLAPVRLSDPDAAMLLSAGQHVDVLVAVEGASSARTVAQDVVVAARPQPLDGERGAALNGTPGRSPATDQAGGLVVLRVSPKTASGLAQAGMVGPLSVVLR
ncbi:MAG: SAF domain-containing protein [Angustibacter sp.]